MTEERPPQEERATSVKQPNGDAPDADLAYDPEMTDTDEANIPPESAADPEDAGTPDED
jgi:hypothetical protein